MMVASPFVKGARVAVITPIGWSGCHISESTVAAVYKNGNFTVRHQVMGTRTGHPQQYRPSGDGKTANPTGSARHHNCETVRIWDAEWEASLAQERSRASQLGVHAQLVKRVGQLDPFRDAAMVETMLQVMDGTQVKEIEG